MSSSQVLKAFNREKVGSRPARKLRREGRIPCSIQPEFGQAHRDISIDEHEFKAARRHHVHLFDIDVAGDVETAVVRELQWDTFGDRIIHVEFKRVQRGVKTETEVEIEYFGHPKGGVINHLVAHVTILSLPSEIPDAVEVKVTELEEGDSIHASDLILPEGVELAPSVDPGLVIATISTARGLEVEPTEEEAEAERLVEGEEPAADGEPPPKPAE